jgi:hypothetical protein
VIVDANGTFAPGNPSGALSIGTDLNLDPAANLQFTLGIASSSATVAGNLALAGNLYVIAGPGFGPGTYTLFNYSGALNFSGITIAAAPGGYNYSISTNTPGVVQLIVSRPQFNHAGLASGQLIMSGSGGATNGTYYVLSSTNPALPLNLWSRIATNQFDASGNFNFSNTVNLLLPRQYYLLELP